MTTDAPRSDRDDSAPGSAATDPARPQTAPTPQPGHDATGETADSAAGAAPPAESAPESEGSQASTATTEPATTEPAAASASPAGGESDGPTATAESSVASTGAAVSEDLNSAMKVSAAPAIHPTGATDGEPAGAPGTHVSVSQDAVAQMPNEPPSTATAPPSETFNTPNTHAGVAPPLAEHAATVQEPSGGIPDAPNAPSESNATQPGAVASVAPPEFAAGPAEPQSEASPSGGSDAAAEGVATDNSSGDEKASGKDRMAQGGNEAAAPVPTQSTSGPTPVVAKAVEIPQDDDLDPNVEAQIVEQLSGSMIAPAAAAAATSAADDEAVKAAEPQVANLAAGDEAAPGMQVEGTVTTIHGDSVFVDFGSRYSGQVPTRQFGAEELPKVGDRLTLLIQSVNEEDGVIVCSRPGSRVSSKRANWDEVSEGQIVDARVTKRNKGGLECSIGSLRGFMPASQVDASYVADLEQFVGQTLQAKVLEVNPAKRKLVVSRKAIQMEARRETETKLFETLAKGDKVQGRVKSIKDFGAFIDLGGADGLLHIGQISWSRVQHPSEMLEVGQDLELQILDIDPEKKKISLSLRELATNPWQLVESKYAVGTTQTGKVTRVADFGAFVALEPGVEGLIHISQIDHRRVRRVEDELSVGQTVEAKVLEIDPGRKRISLSLKALKSAPEQLSQGEDDGPRQRRPRRKDLRGGSSTGGKSGLFGDPRDFS